MSWHEWLTVGALAVCLGSLSYHLFRLIRLGKPRDFAKPAGSESEGIRYSFTSGMNPARKESAYLHLPTYSAGLLYHAGTFISLALLVLSLVGLFPEGTLAWIAGIFLGATGIAGIFILIKRMVVRKLRILSNPDDYLSNVLVTLFQIFTIVRLAGGESWAPAYHIISALLLLYLPLGKLKHLVYFFAARYQLGIFYGRRGVWTKH